MAKQTFTTGQVLTAAQVNSLQANDFNQTVSLKTANYTLVAADKGTRIEFNTSGSVTCTVNSGLFDAGDTLVIQNRGAGTATITAGTATVNTSASLALAQYSAGTLYFVSDSAALFFGDAAGISASIVDAKGDLIVGTADNTVGRLAVGTNGHTLVADSAETTGLKWQAPASGGMTLLSTTSLTGAATITISSISQSYTNLYILITGLNVTTGTYTLKLRPDGSDANNYSNLRGATVATSGPDYISPGNAGHSASSTVNDYALMFFNYTDTVATKPFFYVGIAKMASQVEPFGVSGFGAVNIASAIDSFQLNNDSGGNFAAGTVKIYGVN